MVEDCRARVTKIVVICPLVVIYVMLHFVHGNLVGREQVRKRDETGMLAVVCSNFVQACVP